MINPEMLLELDLVSNVFVVAAVLSLIVRSLQGERGIRLESTLETIDAGITAGADRVEDAYERLQFQYGELKELYLRYKAGAKDGVSLDEAAAVAEDVTEFTGNVMEFITKKTGE